MDLHYLTVILLGIVEGLTEFLPVSSTGHLILASELLGYDASTWAMFNVIIQLGAILAVVVLYWRTFWAVGMGLLRREPTSWRFLRNLLVAFIPAAIIGLALHDHIEQLLGAPKVVAWALIAGGVAILAIERMVKENRFHGIADIPLIRVVGIGLIQCMAMIPGVSRSGATIMGALTGGGTAHSGGIQLLPRHPDHVGGIDIGTAEEWRQADIGGGGMGQHRSGLLRVLHRRPAGHQMVRGAGVAARLRAICLVSNRRRNRRPGVAFPKIGPNRPY